AWARLGAGVQSCHGESGDRRSRPFLPGPTFKRLRCRNAAKSQRFGPFCGPVAACFLQHERWIFDMENDLESDSASLTPQTRTWVESVLDGYGVADHQVRLLVLAGQAYDRAQEARRVLDAEGILTQDRYGSLKPHPAIAIERDARIGYARLVRELALETPQPEDEEFNEFMRELQNPPEG